MTILCVHGAFLYYIVIFLEAYVLDLRSNITYYTERNAAMFFCMWNANQKPTTIEFLSAESQRYFSCNISRSTHFCSRGPAAFDRHIVSTSRSGSAWMIIGNLTPSDEGKYKCDIVKVKQTGDKIEIEKNSSDLYLNYKELTRPKTQKNNIETASTSAQFTGYQTNTKLNNEASTLNSNEKTKTPESESASNVLLKIAILTTIVVFLTNVFFYVMKNFKDAASSLTSNESTQQSPENKTNRISIIT